MKKYRKKPVIIEAIQLTEDNFEEVFNFLDIPKKIKRVKEYYSNETDMVNKKPSGVFLRTCHGTTVAKIGDYIIKGVHGEFYPCKSDIFKETYEEIIKC